MRCCVPFCKSYVVNKKLTEDEKQRETLKFFQIPSKADVREKWIKNIAKRDWIPSDRATVCNLHFEPEDFKLGLKVAKLKPDAVPTLFPHYPKYMQEAAKKLCKTRRQPKIRTAPQIRKRKRVKKQATPVKNSISNSSAIEKISSSRVTEKSQMESNRTTENPQVESNRIIETPQIESNRTSENPQIAEIPLILNSTNDVNNQSNKETNTTNAICNKLLSAIHDHSLLSKPVPTPNGTQIKIIVKKKIIQSFINEDNIPKRGRPAIPYAELKKQLNYYKQRTWWLNKKVDELTKKNKSLKEELKEKRKYDQNFPMYNKNLKMKFKDKTTALQNKQTNKFCTVYCISADV